MGFFAGSGGAAVLFAATLCVGCADHSPWTDQAACDEASVPKDALVEAPGANVSPDLARFLGVWHGKWEGSRCDSTLVVADVSPDGSAKILYLSSGFWFTPGGGLNMMYAAPAAEEDVARIENGELEFTRKAYGNAVVFVLGGDKLSATTVVPTSITAGRSNPFAGTQLNGSFIKS